MNNSEFKKVSDILNRASSASQSLIEEEIKYKAAIQNKESTEQINAIVAKINFLKRKYSLLTQAAEMRRERGGAE